MALRVGAFLSVYDGEKPEYLRAALRSVAVQAGALDEFVIVLDGPLRTALRDVLAAELAALTVPRQLIELPVNVGLGNALNVGSRQATVDFLARVDSDDINRPDRFLRQRHFLAENPDIDVVGGWIEEFTDQPGDLCQIRRTPCAPEEFPRFARYRNPFNHMTVAFRRSAVLAAGGYIQLPLLEDYYLWVRMLRHSMRFANLPTVLVDARINAGTFARRHGLAYFRNERVLFREMLAAGLISGPQYGFNLTARFALRCLPRQVLTAFYPLFLRRR